MGEGVPISGRYGDSHPMVTPVWRHVVRDDAGAVSAGSLWQHPPGDTPRAIRRRGGPGRPVAIPG